MWFSSKMTCSIFVRSTSRYQAISEFIENQRTIFHCRIHLYVSPVINLSSQKGTLRISLIITFTVIFLLIKIDNLNWRGFDRRIVSAEEYGTSCTRTNGCFFFILEDEKNAESISECRRTAVSNDQTIKLWCTIHRI